MVTPASNMAIFGIYVKFLGCNIMGIEGVPPALNANPRPGKNMAEN